MKALLIAECEGFIKNKRYISYILFLLLCGINGVFAIKSLNPQDKFPTILFMIFFVDDFKKGNFINSQSVRLLPIKQQSLVRVLFLEVGIYNLVLILGWLIYCVVLGRLIFPDLIETGFLFIFESLIIPDILPKKKMTQPYLEHILILVLLACFSGVIITQTTLDKNIGFLFFTAALIVMTYFSSIRILKVKEI
jgi:hypothetical protein